VGLRHSGFCDDGDDTPMKSMLICLSMIALLSLTDCADPDSVSALGSSVGIDQDISASHDTGATSLRDLSLPDLALRQ
jgi:hypothetical protein